MSASWSPSGPLRLEPLRAWRFVAGKVSALGAVTSPPYDVLEPAIVRRLTDSDLHNMVRLILPRDPGLGPRRYDGAARRLAGWQRDGIVVQDPRPALYVYEQRIGDAVLCGLVGALGLDPGEQVVLPHEDVMPQWVDDRHDLMEATDADLEPILLAYSGSDSVGSSSVGSSSVGNGSVGNGSVGNGTVGNGTVGNGTVFSGSVGEAIDLARTGEPWLVAETENGAEHRIWRIDSPAVLARIAADLARNTALIADGHHRYAAYLKRLRLTPDRPGAGLGLAMLVDHDRHPLTLDAIHRTVPGLDLSIVSSRTPTGWQVLPGRVDGVPDRIAVTDGTDWLTLRPTGTPAPAVARLHEELVPAWGMDPHAIAYHHALSDALAGASPARAAIELEPPRLDQVLSTAAQGTRLPHKATSFGPKPRVGLLFRTLP